MFVPHDCVDWLGGEPHHEAYERFYGIDDVAAARQYRIGLARQMASGLRIVIKESQEQDQHPIVIKTREYPALISPRENRKNGGGYVAFDPNNEDDQQELRRQAATSMAAWLSRYRGCAESFGLDLTPLEEITQALRGVEDDQRILEEAN